jgi:hypothetical protein
VVVAIVVGGDGDSRDHGWVVVVVVVVGGCLSVLTLASTLSLS